MPVEKGGGMKKERTCVTSRRRLELRYAILGMLAASGMLGSTFHLLVEDAIDGVEVRIARHLDVAKRIRRPDTPL